MGGKSQETTVGYKNFLGQHLVFAVSGAEGIGAVYSDDREVWVGPVGKRHIRAFKPDLWGGDEREGGFVGHLIQKHGDDGQSSGPYLKQVLYDGMFDPGRVGSFGNPGNVPDFLRTWTLIHRQPYIGNNPYPKRLRYKFFNVYNTFGRNWLGGVAGVNARYRFDGRSIHVALENSTYFSATEWDNAKEAIKALGELITDTNGADGTTSLRVQEFNTSAGPAFERIPFTSADQAALESYLDGIVKSSNVVQYNTGITSAEAFFDDCDAAFASTLDYGSFEPAATGEDAFIMDFNIGPVIDRVILFMSTGNGAPTLAESTIDAMAQDPTEPDVYGVGLNEVSGGPALGISELQRAEGTVAVWSDDADGVDGLLRVLARPFRTHEDCNPAHIIRDILCNRECGGPGNADDVDDANFQAAARTLHAEGMGVSMKWRSGATRDDMLRLIEDHIDGVVYRDRTTGDHKLQLIRPADASVETFEGAGPSARIVEWTEEFEKPEPDQLPNKVILNYSRIDNGQTTSVSLINPAALLISNSRIKAVKVEMPGIHDPDLAWRVCQRELQARTLPFGRGRIRVTYISQDTHVGAKITVNDADAGLANVAFRVLEISEPHMDDASVVLTIAEDIWQGVTVDDQIGSDEVAEGGTVDTTAQAASVHFFEELSYYDQVLARGQGAIESALDTDPDLGNWHLTTDRPNTAHVSSRIVRNEGGSTWVTAAQGQLMPTWELNAALSRNPTVTSFVCATNGRESELVANQRIQIGNEIMRVDSVVVDTTAGTATFTVGRACLDSVPESHASGATVMAFPRYTGSDSVDYTAGETITVRALLQTFSETLAIDDAVSQVLTMDSRAIRPYPVGQFQIEGSYDDEATVRTGNIDATYVHRDRETQTSTNIADHTDAAIGPEGGTSYHLLREVIEDSGGGETVVYSDEIDASPVTALTITTDVDELNSELTVDTVGVDLSLITRRGGYDSLRNPKIRIQVANPQAVTLVQHPSENTFGVLQVGDLSQIDLGQHQEVNTFGALIAFNNEFANGDVFDGGNAASSNADTNDAGNSASGHQHVADGGDAT